MSLHLLPEQTTGLASLTEMGGQRVDVNGLVELQRWVALKDIDQGPGGARGLLLAEADGFFDQVGREGARFPLVSAGLGTQGVEATFTVDLEVAAQGGYADAGARGGGDGVGLGSDLAQASLLLLVLSSVEGPGPGGSWIKAAMRPYLNSAISVFRSQPAGSDDELGLICSLLSVIWGHFLTHDEHITPGARHLDADCVG